MKIENTNKNFISLLKRLSVFSMVLVKKFLIKNSCKITFNSDLNLKISSLIERKSLDNLTFSKLSSSLSDFSQYEINILKKDFDFLSVFDVIEVYFGELKDVQDSLLLLYLILNGEIKTLSELKKRYLALQTSAIYDEYIWKAKLFFKGLSLRGQSFFQYIESKITATDKNEQFFLLVEFLKEDLKLSSFNAESLTQNIKASYKNLLTSAYELIKLKLYLLSDESIFLKYNDTALVLLKTLNSL